MDLSKRTAQNPQIKIVCVANVFFRNMHFVKAGDFEVGHKHSFDHVTHLGAGALDVEVEGQHTRFDAPALIFIDKGKVHKLTALEDDTNASCIHALRDGDRVEDIIDPDMVPRGVELRSLVKKIIVDEVRDEQA